MLTSGVMADGDWLEAGQKVGVSPPGMRKSLMAVIGVVRSNRPIIRRGWYLDGWPPQRMLVDAKKWHEQ